MKNCLSIEQSAELIKRGVTKDKASEKDRIYKPIVAQNGVAHNIYVSDAPIFTLADLLSLLPKEIDGCNLTIGASKEEWRVAYELNEMDDDDNFVITRIIMVQFSKELIDALFLALCNCLDNHVKLD